MTTTNKKVRLVIEMYEDLLYNNPVQVKKAQDEYRQYAKDFQTEMERYMCYLEEVQISCRKKYEELYLKKDNNIFFKLLKHFRIKKLSNDIETISVELKEMKHYNERLNAILHRFEQIKYLG